MNINRRHFMAMLGTASAAAVTPVPLRGKSTHHQSHGEFQWNESTIAQLQRALERRKTDSASLVRAYLGRIDAIDRNGPQINSVIETNPDALAIADEMDRERRTKGPRGLLHGIPILIKDNVDTCDRMRTTAGSLALVRAVPLQDSFIVQRLRAAGAIILGKTNLSEWANFRSTRSTSGWSGRGGLTRNPYVLDRNPSGSSSGTGAAVTANLCAAGVGTETDGSIVMPSAYNGLVGLKPTIGLVSRTGIIPISHSQDTAGPMARTVTDAAILLGVLAGKDPKDLATQHSSAVPADYTAFLEPHGLRGMRLGVARQFFGIHPAARKLAERMLEVLRSCGAVLIDPADIPNNGSFSDEEDLVLHYEFKAGINAYLAGLGPKAPVKSLQELIVFNQQHQEREMPYFGQEIFLRAQEQGPLTDPEYLKALKMAHRLTREQGIDAVMNQHKLDAIVAPTAGPAHVTDLLYGDRDTGGCTSPAAVAGYPHITVPAGQVCGLPVGLSFFGKAFSEPTLLKCAFAFEQATKARQAPNFLPTIGNRLAEPR